MEGIQAGHVLPGQHLQNGGAGGNNGPSEGEGQPFAGLERGEICRGIAFRPNGARSDQKGRYAKKTAIHLTRNQAIYSPLVAGLEHVAANRSRHRWNAAYAHDFRLPAETALTERDRRRACIHSQNPVNMGKYHRHNQPRNPKPKGVNAQGDENWPGLPAWRD